MAYEELRLSLSNRLAALREEKNPSTPKGRGAAGAAKPTVSVPATKAKSSDTYALTTMDVEGARKSARAAERSRVADVFASKASIGRERMAADMLAHSEESAATITTRLAAIPTDAERQAGYAAQKQQAASQIWDRVIGKMN